MKKIMILLVIMGLAFSGSVFAGTLNDNANSSDYLVKAPAMILRGVSNAVVSPVEIFSHGYKGTMEGRPIVGTLQGVGEGTIWMLDRVGRGAWDILTSFAPNYNGAPPTHEMEFFTSTSGATSNA